MKLPLARIAEVLAASGEFDPNALAQGYSIDSRTIRPGELFFAVKGENFDGHDFVERALGSGIAAIVRKDQLGRYQNKTSLIAVEDTLSALQRLATAVRRLWAKPLVGITGSAGKTTTKEAIAHLLATRFRVLKSEGNFNNHFGLPLMLLKLEREHDIAVIEMGMSHAGEIAALAEIARAKYELVESLASGGTVVLNADDEYVSQFGRNFKGKVVLFGIRPIADVRAENITPRGAEGSSFDLVVGGCRENVLLPLVGAHNIQNSLAAVAVALERGLSPSDAANALASLRPADKRGQVLQVGNIAVINDCYNSNPKALEAMIDALAEMSAKRRIVVAGEMLELGPAAEDLHRRSGQHASRKGIDIVIGVRGHAKQIAEAARDSGIRAEFLSTPEEAGEWLARETREGDVVLLKASRGVKLERALDTWNARRSNAASGRG